MNLIDKIKIDLKDINLKEKLFFIALLLDLIFLICFGKHFTKFVVYNNLHLHDCLLLTIFIFTFFFKKVKGILSIDFLVFLSFFYLLISLKRIFFLENGLYIVLRQFMLFGYLIIGYNIVRVVQNFKNGFKLCMWLILITGIIAVISQILFIFYLFFIKEENRFLISRYNYLSPMVQIGIIIMSSFILIHFSSIKRQVFFILLFIMSISVGHDSAYLSLLVVYFVYFFIKSSFKTKWVIIIIFISTIILGIFFIPTMTDLNTIWRLIYWREAIKDLIITNDIFLGKGFGIPYLNEATRLELNKLMEPYGDFTRITYTKNFETTSHNSFITFVQHMGVIGLILLILPFNFINFKNLKDVNVLILFLSAVGLFFWASFNLILELPHSSICFWLIFFSFIYGLRIHSEKL